MAIVVPCHQPVKTLKYPFITAFPKLELGQLLHRRAGAPDDQLLGGDCTVFLSSARAAAFQAIKHFAIEKPFKVLVPAYHCGVEIEAILRAGAGIEYYAVKQDMTVCCEEIRARLNPHVKAIFLIHYWGLPQDTAAVAEVCKQHDLFLIEDCAHALFSQSDGRPVGGVGDAAIYSLPKTLPTPDGGVLRVKRSARPVHVTTRIASWVAYKAAVGSLLQRMRSAPAGPWANLAELVFALKERPDRSTESSWQDYGETALTGYAHRVSGLSSLVFRRSSGPGIAAARRRNYEALLEHLEGVDGLETICCRLQPGVCPLFLPIVISDRAGLEQYLSQHRVETFVFGRKLHPTLRRDEFPVADFLSQHVLGLPVHQGLRQQDVRRIAQLTKDWLARGSAAVSPESTVDADDSHQQQRVTVRDRDSDSYGGARRAVETRSGER